MSKRIVSVKVNPGEPTDGSGQVCIHLFVPDPRGPFVEPHVFHPVVKDGQTVKGQIEAKPTRGRLACDPRRTVVPTTRNGITTITPRTDDPRAVSCEKCISSEDYKQMMIAIKQHQG